MPFFAAFGAAGNDGMLARWSANPLGMLLSERDTVFMTPAGSGAAIGGHRCCELMLRKQSRRAAAICSAGLPVPDILFRS